MEDQADQRYQQQAPKRRCFSFLYVAAFFAIIGGFNFGYDLGVITNTITPISNEFGLSSFRKEVIVSSLLGGAAVGAIATGWLSDRYGRKRSVIGSSALFLIGAVLISTANSFWTLLLGRLMSGLGTGASLVTMVYLAELAPAAKRGSIVSSNELSITFGIFVSLALGKILIADDSGSTSSSSFSTSGSHQSPYNIMTWRIMFILLTIPSAFQFIGMMFMPESPRWLFMKGRNEEALYVLQKLRDIDDVTLERNAMQINNQSIVNEHPAAINDNDNEGGEEGEDEGAWKNIFNADMRKRFLIGMGVVFFQQTTGQTTVLYYCSIILETVFSTRAQITTATLMIGVVKMVAALLAMQVIDRVGRRFLLLFGTIGAVVSLTIIASCFFGIQDSTDSSGTTTLQLNPTTGWILFIAIIVFFLMYGLSFGPVGWVLPSEIYPMKVRGQAMSITLSFNYIVNFAVALTFLNLISAFGHVGAFFFYAGVSVVGFLFIYFLVPETKGKTLEEIQTDLFSQPSLASAFSFRLFQNEKPPSVEP